MQPDEFPVSELSRAIDVYLSVAYTAAPPATVQARIDQVRSAPGSGGLESKAFERDSPTAPAKWSLRLGNRLYPHMKLTVERSPDGAGYLFRADTHDRHCCPLPGAKEHDAFRQLMAANEQIAKQIETAWAERGISTFKTYLREDLARRARQACTTD